jgi:acetylornithine deacetylase
MNIPRLNPDGYEAARDMMDLMVQTSQQPGEGNEAFVAGVGLYLSNRNFVVESYEDPQHKDRELLVVDFGDPDGEQVLAAISHGDVVSVKNQKWNTDPFVLTEDGDKWLGRGVCDTHGSGVAMLLAGARPDVTQALAKAGKRVSVVFTYDEEAPDAYWSYRGAKVAVGEYGADPVITSKYFIAGEPTEPENSDTIIARRAHKGRWLARFTLNVGHPGHSAENVQNALGLAIESGHEIYNFSASHLQHYHPTSDSQIFNPAHSTAQVTAGEVKNDAFSITANTASFVVDLRTLPGFHDTHKNALRRLLEGNGEKYDEGVSMGLEVLDDFAGTITPGDSPIVIAAQKATQAHVLGFNGGDEGEVLRRHNKEGITLGPGKLSFAHAPNEEIKVDSIFKATEIYAQLFRNAINMK